MRASGCRFLILTIGCIAALTASFAARAEEWKPVFSEDFKPGWEQNWTLKGSVGPLDQGALLGTGKELRAELNRKAVAPAIRLEYDATMLDEAGEGASDLSCYIGQVLFRFGGENNTVSDIQGPGEFVPPPAPAVFTLKKPARVVAEVNGLACRLTVDGKAAGELLLKAPIQEAAVALYCWSGKPRFERVRVFTKSQADATPEDLDRRARAQAVALKAAPVETEAAMTLGAFRAAPTIHSIGFEWDLKGDANHNAVCPVRYRAQGAAEWKQGFPLLRIDYRGWYDAHKHQAWRRYNMLAGSLMFLEPDTVYEVELAAKDPDGGEQKRVLMLKTRAVPALAAPLRTLHVIPGAGGGTGAKDDPFKGIAAADAAAQPGDLFLLHAGAYKGYTLQKSGTPQRYIAWKAAGDGEAVLKGALGIGNHNVWIEGIVFNPDAEQDFGGIRGKNHPHHNIVAVRNTFRNCRYAFSNTDKEWRGGPEELNRQWYIADNIMDGGTWTEYGCRLYLIADSDICYNRISKNPVNDKGGDGVSLRFCNNVDVYGNDLRDIDDDLFEPDSSYGNIRIWQNRGINPRFQAVSFQPMLCSPWYIVRNEFVLTEPARHATPFKCNVFDRAVIVNNTFFVRGRYGQYRADLMLKGFSRNNLWTHLYDNPSQKTNPGGALWAGEGDGMKDGRYSLGGQTRPDWRTDVDYDGFAWQNVPDMKFPFWWSGLPPQRFATLDAFAKALGVEMHATALAPEDIFEVGDVIAYGKAVWPPQRLTLKAGCKAIDAGAPVPNLCESFLGKAPDLGAYEFGAPPTHYGPRP